MVLKEDDQKRKKVKEKKENNQIWNLEQQLSTSWKIQTQY